MRDPWPPRKGHKEPTKEDNKNENKNLSIQDVVESMDPPFRDAYKDPSEIQNYRQEGSYFHGKNISEIRDLIKKNALEHGLHRSQLADFKNGSILWKNEKREVEGQIIDSGETVYFTNFERIHLAQGFTVDTMFVTVPLWYDRKVLDRKTGEVLYTKRELTNFVVLSSHEIIRPTDKYFIEKGIVAEFPETILSERWSMGSIREFREGSAFIDPRAVFHKIKGIWEFFMDLSGNPGAYTALTLINTLGYCLRLFQYAPYIKYEGEKGSSKSKACEIHEYIDFNAFSGVDLTPSVIFRTLQDTRGTLIIDEAETYDKLKNKSEYEQAREAIINAGFKINGKVPRMERIDNRFTRVDYHVFGIKIIGSIHGVSETIRDRSYQVMLTKTLNKEISRRTPRFGDPMFQEARDMLYTMVLNHWKEIQKIEQEEEIENRLGLIGREWDKAKPLLVLATFYAMYDPGHGKEIIDDLWIFLSDQKNREISLTIDTFDEVVIDQVELAIKEKAEKERLTIADNTDFTLSLLEISLRIAALEGKKESRNFNPRNYSRSVKNKIVKLAVGGDFRHGTGNVTVFTSNLYLIKNARKRYGISPSAEEKQEAFNSINSINLINSINSFNYELMKVNQNPELRNSINSLLTRENADSLIRGVNQLIELIAEMNKEGSHSENTSDLSLTDEEVALIAYREKKIPLIRIKEKWHNFDCPSADVIRNSAAKLATMDNPKIAFNNDVIEWIGDRWSG